MPFIQDLPNAVGGKSLKNAEPLSEVRQRVLILGSDFQKQGEEKVSYYSMHFLVALDSKATALKGCFCTS